MKKSLKQRYMTSAFILLIATVIVKIISAVYKIPLTAYIGAEGRGYFSIAYNLCLPVHALTMGAFPLALTKLISSYEAKGNKEKIYALRRASKRLFFIVGVIGLLVMLVLAKPYSSAISSSPKSIYTILALAPSVFFSCLGASHRAYAEGFFDMKATAVSQLLEALFKMVFGLLFARLSMSGLYECYLLNKPVFGVTLLTEQEALSFIYPLTSAAAMLGTTLGSIVAYLFAMIYAKAKYPSAKCGREDAKLAYNELLAFSASLIGATVIQSLSNFVDTSSIQYFLSLCSEQALSESYHYSGNDIYTYVFGIFATILDFKNLVPSIVMALGVTAVPAVSTAFENSSGRFSSLMSSILKYTVILSVLGGLILAVFHREILSMFYIKSNPDIVENGSQLLFMMGVLVLPCSLATTTVYCAGALGFAKNTILPFILSSVVRVVLNYVLITNDDVNILGAAVSNFVGFLIIVIMNIITICRKTKAEIKLMPVFINPVVCGVLAYFLMDYMKDSAEISFSVFILLIVSCVIIYILLLFFTKTLTFKEKFV
ncbi:MAG: oligosaccharide flippase family protein [Clostridium sp.]|nr:oligosaccharide flippase family protein [Clostridium sp.]